VRAGPVGPRRLLAGACREAAAWAKVAPFLAASPYRARAFARRPRPAKAGAYSSVVAALAKLFFQLLLRVGVDLLNFGGRQSAIVDAHLINDPTERIIISANSFSGTANRGIRPFAGSQPDRV
jgi:hypothetical protein